MRSTCLIRPAGSHRLRPLGGSTKAHHVIMTVLAGEGNAGITWNAGAAFTHQITERFWEQSGSKHTYGETWQQWGSYLECTQRQWVCECVCACLSYTPPTEIKSKAELTPAERLLNLCSRCLMPPMIMQIPCTHWNNSHKHLVIQSGPWRQMVNNTT